MTDKRFNTALLRWSVFAGVLVSVFWLVWMQFAPLPSYFKPWPHARLWWADALLVALSIYAFGRALRWFGHHDPPADGYIFRGVSAYGIALVPTVVGVIVGFIIGEILVACVGLIMGAMVGMVVGRIFGEIVDRAVGGVVGWAIDWACVTPLRKLFDFLCAKNVTD